MNLTARHYNFAEAKTDPIKHFSFLVGLDKHLSVLQKDESKVLKLLTGIVLYRQLSRLDKQKTLEIAQSYNNPALFSSVQQIVALNIANPNWNMWSLSDQELRSFFNSNKAVYDFISKWLITVDGKFEAGFMIGAIYAIASEGPSSFIKGQAAIPALEAALSKLKISTSATKASGRAFLALVLMASVMKKFKDVEIKQAKIELLNRGLLQPGDL